MNWHLHSWRFRLQSPLHVGFHKVMHFFRTRPYVPGRLLWGALTAKLTPMLGANDYPEVGGFLKNAMRFGYLYPCCGKQLFLPKYTEKGLMFGSLSRNEFQKKFTSSLASTAIDSDSLSAEEDTLHEVEIINPYTIDDGNPIFLEGLFWIREISENGLTIIRKNNSIFINHDELEIDFKNQLANAFQVGGERKYGFGLLELKELSESNDIEAKGFSGQWSESEDSVYLKLGSNSPIWSHLLHQGGIDIKGDIEPLVGRDWDTKGAGKKLANQGPGLYWSPGSILNKDTKCRISDFGLWEAVK